MIETARALSVPVADLAQMIESMECDNRIRWCDSCGAWLTPDDPALATTDEYTGCWRMASGRKRDEHLCRSDRAALTAAVKAALQEPST